MGSRSALIVLPRAGNRARWDPKEGREASRGENHAGKHGKGLRALQTCQRHDMDSRTDEKAGLPLDQRVSVAQDGCIAMAIRDTVSEPLARRTGCGKSARPGLWGARVATSSPTRPFRRESGVTLPSWSGAMRCAYCARRHLLPIFMG